MSLLDLSPAALRVLLGGGVSLVVTMSLSWLLVRTRRWHDRWTGDTHWHLPQKIHHESVPRVGGIAIVLGFVVGIMVCVSGVGPTEAAWLPSMRNTLLLLLGLAPVALVGFAEDLTKGVSPRVRLLGMVVGSFILLYGRDIFLPRLDIDLIDPLMRHWGVALVFSIFACVGATNAYNIVDGLNGLLAGVVLITLSAVAWVAWDVGDVRLCITTAVLALAVLGWLPFNWPRARLFAGDGGAYSLGFLSAALIIILLHRNPQVSPWFGLTAAALPIWETLYSIWRRQRTGMSALEPDQSHLHQLVRTRMHWQRMYRALRRAGVGAPGWVPPTAPGPQIAVAAPNASCSPMLWGLHASAAAAGAAFYDRPTMAASIFACFVLLYVGLHTRLVRSRRKYRPALVSGS